MSRSESPESSSRITASVRKISGESLSGVTADGAATVSPHMQMAIVKSHLKALEIVMRESGLFGFGDDSPQSSRRAPSSARDPLGGEALTTSCGDETGSDSATASPPSITLSIDVANEIVVYFKRLAIAIEGVGSTGGFSSFSPGNRKISMARSPPPIVDPHSGELVGVFPSLARPIPGGPMVDIGASQLSAEQSMTDPFNSVHSAQNIVITSTSSLPVVPQALAAISDDPDVARWLNENFSQAKAKKHPPSSARNEESSNANNSTTAGRDVGFLTKSFAPVSSTHTPVNEDDGAKLSTTDVASLKKSGADRLNDDDFGSKRISLHDGTKSEATDPVSTRRESIVSVDDHNSTGHYARKSIMARCKSSNVNFVQRRLTEHNLEWLDVDNIDFDIFEVLRKYDGDHAKVFVNVCANVLFRYQLIQSMELNVPKLMSFLRAVQRSYQDENPYHNSVHAADVLQTAHIYLATNDVRDNFSNEEVLVVLFSAIVHDVGHLGIGNNFLIKTHHPLASLYNDSSPLESMHATLAFHILEKKENNFFDTAVEWGPERAEQFRAQVLQVVVGTDMKFHQQCTASVVDILADGVIEDEEIGKLLSAIVHAADLSNPMKPLSIYKNWCDRVMAEFWQQGDEERSRGMPLSMMCDRNNCAIAASQVGFINFIVKPFMSEFSMLLPEKWMVRLEANLSYMMAHRNDNYDVSEIARLASRRWKDTWHRSALAKMFAETLELERTHTAALQSSTSAAKSPRSGDVSALQSPSASMTKGSAATARTVEQLRRRLDAVSALCNTAESVGSLAGAVLRLMHVEVSRHLRDPFPSKLDILESTGHFAQNLLRLVDKHLGLTESGGNLVADAFGRGIFTVGRSERRALLDNRRWCVRVIRENFAEADAPPAGTKVAVFADIIRALSDLQAGLESSQNKLGDVVFQNHAAVVKAETSFIDSSVADASTALAAKATDFIRACAATWFAVADFTAMPSRAPSALSLAPTPSLGGGRDSRALIVADDNSSRLRFYGAEHAQNSVYAEALAPLIASNAPPQLRSGAVSALAMLPGRGLHPALGPRAESTPPYAANSAATKHRLQPLQSSSAAAPPPVAVGASYVDGITPLGGYTPPLTNGPATPSATPSDTPNARRAADKRVLVTVETRTPDSGRVVELAPGQHHGAQQAPHQHHHQAPLQLEHQRRRSIGDDSVMMWTLPELRDPSFDIPHLQVPTGTVSALQETVGERTHSEIVQLLPTPNHRRLLEGSPRASSRMLSSPHSSSGRTLQHHQHHTPLPEVLLPHVAAASISSARLSNTNRGVLPDFYDTLRSEAALQIAHTTTTTTASGGRQPVVRSHVHPGPLVAEETPRLDSTLSSTAGSLPALPDVYRRNRSWSKGSGNASDSPKSSRSPKSGRGGAMLPENPYTPTGDGQRQPRGRM